MVSRNLQAVKGLAVPYPSGNSKSRETKKEYNNIANRPQVFDLVHIMSSGL